MIEVWYSPELDEFYEPGKLSHWANIYLNGVNYYWFYIGEL